MPVCPNRIHCYSLEMLDGALLLISYYTTISAYLTVWKINKVGPGLIWLQTSSFGVLLVRVHLWCATHHFKFVPICRSNVRLNAW